MILSGCLFLVYFCSCTVHSQTRASVLYCLLSQTDRSIDSQTRATALHRLLSQAVCSLMTQEKQMPPFRRRLFFVCGHHMLTLSAISARLDSFSLGSPLTLKYPFILSIFVRFLLPQAGQTSISSSSWPQSSQ